MEYFTYLCNFREIGKKTPIPMKPRPSNTRPYYIWRPVKIQEELIACKSNIRKIFRKFYLLCQFKSSFLLIWISEFSLEIVWLSILVGWYIILEITPKGIVLDPHFSSRRFRVSFLCLLYEKRKSMKE